MKRRKKWNTRTPEEAGLPTEIWRETVARRQRYADVRGKLERGEVQSINDLITLNLDIRQFAQDVIERCESPDLLNAFWTAIAGYVPTSGNNKKAVAAITVLDPTCGSGAFLFAALNILEPLYEACLERMKGFLEEWSGCGTGSGTAVSAVIGKERTGETPVPPPVPLVSYFNPKEDLSISRRYLPHWEQVNALYFITFRLGDALPVEKLRQWQCEKDDWLETNPSPWTNEKAEEYAERFPERIDRWLDAGSGSCILKQPEVSKIVESALLHFDGSRYNLFNFVIMPNHVHLLVQPLPGNELSKILHSWKSFTAHEINKHLGRTGQVWQDESYDHLVRNEEQHRHYQTYIKENPIKSGTAVSAVIGNERTGETPVPPPVPPKKHKHPNYAKFFQSIVDEVSPEKHPSPKYFIYKSIIIHNLYGVDIMKEATEICKLRLFLKLVAQVEDGKKIEPLPDIDFNIRAGNTLVGFATEEEMKRAMQGDLLAYQTVLPEILEQAEECDRLFNLFREAQLEGDGSLVKAKVKLTGKLDDLNARLNQYLAQDYGIDHKKKDAFEDFLKTHQPFHWFIEFFSIIESGGFDAVVGNPPYVELRKNKLNYALRGFSVEGTCDLYSYCTERTLVIAKVNGFAGLIVPISMFGVDGFSSLQRVWCEKVGFSWISSFSNRPSQLFDGAQKRLSIVLGQRSSSPCEFFTTQYYRWKKKERENLFKGYLRYVENKTPYSTFPSSLEKVGRKIASSFYQKLIAGKGVLGWSVADIGISSVYYTRSFGYFLSFLSRPPKMVSIKTKKIALPSELKALKFDSEEMSLAVIAVLSSSTFFTFWNLLSDCRNLNRREIAFFPLAFSKNNLGMMKTLSLKAEQYLRSLYENSGQMEKSGYHIETFQLAHEKELLDEIDAVLAKHYGFTDEELDYIINYDIKYRMGKDLLEAGK